MRGRGTERNVLLALPCLLLATRYSIWVRAGPEAADVLLERLLVLSAGLRYARFGSVVGAGRLGVGVSLMAVNYFIGRFTCFLDLSDEYVLCHQASS
jgi:hypothetical protein